MSIVASAAPGAAAGQESLPRVLARIPLPDVEGRIDHLTVDSDGDRLFVAALGNDTVEVVDLAQNRRVSRLEGLREPQGVLYLATTRRLFVTEGEGDGVAVYGGEGLAHVGNIAVGRDADNIRYEAVANRLWVGAGEGDSGALAAIDPEVGGVVVEIALDGHPESFQLEASGSRIFVNVPRREEVEVVDRERREIVDRWRLPCAANFPMALDEGRRRLFVGCRRPPKLLALDTGTGTVAAALDAPGDTDDIFLDADRDRVYVSGGEGLVRIYTCSETAPNGLHAVGDVATGPGARTSLFVRQSSRLYVAVPRRASAAAEVLVLETSSK